MSFGDNHYLRSTGWLAKRSESLLLVLGCTWREFSRRSLVLHVCRCCCFQPTHCPNSCSNRRGSILALWVRATWPIEQMSWFFAAVSSSWILLLDLCRFRNLSDSGFYVNIDSIPIYYIWLRSIAFQKYVFEVMVRPAESAALSCRFDEPFLLKFDSTSAPLFLGREWIYGSHF